MEYFCHRSKGRLFIAEPRAKDRGNRKWWLLMRVDPEIINCYSWHCQRYGWEMVRGSRWGPHISVVAGEKPRNKDLWYKLSNRRYHFNYSINQRTDGHFIWLDVQSDDLENVRMDLGLSRRPYFSFHLTLGRFRHMAKLD